MSVRSWFVHRTLHPLNGGQIKPFIAAKNSSNPDCGCHGIKWHPNSFPLKVLRFGYLALVDNNEAVAKCSTGEKTMVSKLLSLASYIRTDKSG